jgi:cobyrinic acid a,c-diamide synthase
MVARLVIGGVSSGVGKTTVLVGLARALKLRGLRVAVFKCGPDYLDPTYHGRAAGERSHNLDGWMMGRDAVLSTFARATEGKDIALIEGVMGLFDGASPVGEAGSTAEIAKWLEAPVLLVCDASGMARSVAALVHGFASFDRELGLSGVICNRVGSRAHLELLAKALREPLIVGGLPKEKGLAFPERHLGLHSAEHDADAESRIDAWAARVAEWFELDRVLALARAAGPVPQPSVAAVVVPVAAAPRVRCRIGLASDPAFQFYYDDNLRRLEALGAELVRFSPISDARLPEVDGLYIGGGYPELHAAALAQNASMRAAVAAFAAAGRPIYAECGGLMYLSRAIRTVEGSEHPMVGVVPGTAVMRDRMQALGYVEVETQAPSLLGPPGLRFRGHQFRYSELQLDGDVEQIFSLRRRRGGEVTREGYAVGRTLASYVHAHWASNPLAAQGFVDACAQSAGSAG